VTKSTERLLRRGLWTLYGVLAAGGFATLAVALFVPLPARSFTLRTQDVQTATTLQPLPGAKDGLLVRRFTRRVAEVARSAAPSKPQPIALEQLIKLTGILDFGGKQPTLAVIEATGESKAYKAGEKVGETGAVVKDIKDYVIVDFEKRRFKVTFTGIQELPANAVGKE
jgi:type II secretory pathway component PulC